MAELAAALPNARSVDIAGSSHLSVLERPAEAAAVLVEFLGAGATASTAQGDAATERGMRVRRAVLGDTHVDAATAAATPETAPFQDFITRYAWGEIWSRPGLTRGERSIATLAVLVADGHEHELRMHVLAALRNGLSRAQIGEIIMHTALYAGLPAANRGLAIMREAFITLDEDGAPES
jgi:4-carboxymuconolactone decarboxylase (EC 4.1.1.44)/3-oxoadipate enol-lactonase (EC 3.1.1.24)